MGEFVKVLDTPTVEPTLREVRRFHIQKRHLEVVGYTSSCPKCRAMQNNINGTVTGHSPACRKRVEEEMLKYEDFTQELIRCLERREEAVEQT